MTAVRTEPFKSKYQVLDTTTRRFIPDCFILFPLSDSGAVKAMRAYLLMLPGDDADRQGLEEWVEHIEAVHREFREMEKTDETA